ncbi:MAG: 4-(cytidine 5'-diphospho)-2-C-methyl-D-erythritol kinase [Ruminococcaceae bacterium]|nr:4-(cytidine 5'-diphospho)-2-C-methyl-D-erythritol kinase [Oscillospiraceae bacterium]
MEIKVSANAKINLTLDIVGTNEKGYHLIDSVFQSISLADKIIIKKAQGLNVLMPDSGVKCEDNIVYLAAQRFFEKARISPCVSIEIEKNIPMSAGLGGGSCDAAVTLLALNKMFDLPLSDNELHEIALSLGADVPFALKGGTMRATGIGEKLEPLMPMPDCYFVLIKKGTKPSTGQMYARLDALENLKHPDTAGALEAIENSDIKALAQKMDNVFAALWDLKPICDLIKSTNPLTVALSGSGPTAIAVYQNEENAKKATEILNKEKIECYLCTPAKTSFIFE